jgi:mono/diheme cytochrome c family protein
MRAISTISKVAGILVLWAVPGLARAATQSDAAARGEKVYNAVCWTCHGRYGRGDGPAAVDVAVPLPDFTDSARWQGRTPAQVLERLRSGGHTPMAIANVIKPEALDDALAYILTLYVPGKHVSLKAGQDIYNGACWVCHGANGDGKGPAGVNLKPPPRDFTSPDFKIAGREEEVFRAIYLGPAQAFHGSPSMPDWGSRLSEQQIRDVMAYLETFQGKH